MKKSVKQMVKAMISVLLAGGLVLSGPVSVGATNEEGLPEKYDLRDEDLVTPVKFQNPWGTCWAFGGVAAIESSLLSYLGMTNEEFKTKNNGKGIDLSEKHISWFAVHPVTEDTCSSQKGEGLYPLDTSGDQSTFYNIGGEPVYIGTLLSSGIGPLFEDDFPYKGKEGFTERDYYTQHPEEVDKLIEAQEGHSLDELYELIKKKGKLDAVIKEFQSEGVLGDKVKADEFTVDDFKKTYRDSALKKIRKRNSYSSHDDWTIDEKDKDGHPNRDRSAGFLLADANTLPDVWIKDDKGNWKGLNEEGITAIKQEILEGRAVSIGFASDQSMPNQSVDETFLNTDTWAHYTFNNTPATHAVCIVGWDDTYSRNNFNRAHRPPGDGAWIVKNSWGSETEYEVTDKGERIGYSAWGVKDETGKHTGYFYLSYYDQSIAIPESIRFSVNLATKSDKMYPLAYDYMPCTGEQLIVKDNKVIKTANVFKNDDGGDMELWSFSTKTGSPNAQVIYELYKLKDGAKSPEDGEYIGKRRAFYRFAGFHREDMINGVPFKDGETIAIVATETVVNDEGNRVYEYVINNGLNKKGAEAEEGKKSYAVGIVNKGESFLYRDNTWFDWSDVMDDELADAMEAEGNNNTDNYAIDNFSIKAYMVPVEK